MPAILIRLDFLREILRDNRKGTLPLDFIVDWFQLSLIFTDLFLFEVDVALWGKWVEWWCDIEKHIIWVLSVIFYLCQLVQFYFSLHTFQRNDRQLLEYIPKNMWSGKPGLAVTLTMSEGGVSFCIEQCSNIQCLVWEDIRPIEILQESTVDDYNLESKKQSRSRVFS